MTDQPHRVTTALYGALGQFRIDCSFDVPAVGVTALFGPSGCGKTSVLRCLAGLEALQGKISFDGDFWQSSRHNIFVPTHARGVGYVFQEASLFPHMTVEQNIDYGARRAVSSKQENISSKEDIVVLLGLERLLKRPPALLSGGERQRVAIARALISNPRLLLMDEPLSGLDRDTKSEILNYLDRLRDFSTIPMIYVSHDIEEVARLADNIVMMSNGRVIASGVSHEIFERLDLTPETGRKGAGVVAVMSVKSHDSAYQLTSLSHGSQTIVMPQVDVAVGTDIRIYIKARDVSLATQKPEGISVRNILKGVVEQLVEDSGTAFVEALINIDGMNIRSRITRAAANEMSLAAGQSIYVLIKSVSFDPRSLGTEGAQASII